MILRYAYMELENERREKRIGKGCEIGPDAYVGRRRGLLASLRDSLQENDISEPRTSLLLAVVAHLPLSPRCGSKRYNEQISVKLADYLKNFPLSHLSVEIPFCDAQLLSSLQCERCNEENFDNDKRNSEKIFRRRQQNFTTVRDKIFHRDQQNFTMGQESVAILQDPSTVNYGLDDATLKIMYCKLVGRAPNPSFEFETFAHSLSVFARLVEDSSVYGFVLKHFLGYNFPITEKNEQAVAVWEVMLSLLLRGSINFLYDEFDVSNFPFQKILFESIICYAAKMTSSLNVFIHSKDIDFELCTSNQYSLFDAVIKYYRTVLSGILNCALSLPDEYYALIDVIPLFTTFLSVYLMDNFTEQCAEIITKHHHNFNKRIITAMPNVFMIALQKRISSFNGTKLIHLLQMLSSIFLLLQDSEIICVTILKRFKDESLLFEQWNEDTALGNISMGMFHCDAMADFLAENLTGRKAIEFAISDVILPFITLLEASATSFSLLYIICKRCITIGSEIISPEILEDLAKSLIDRLARELTFVSIDIWALIDIADFAVSLLHVADLLLLLLSRCNEKALPSGLVKYAEQNGLAFIRIALDWLLAPTDVHSHVLRISQLFSLSLQIVLTTDIAEENEIEWIQSNLLNNGLLISNMRLLECFIRILLHMAYSPIQCKQSSSIEKAVKSRNNFGSQIFAISIMLLQKHVQTKLSVSSSDEYYIRKICNMFRHVVISAKLVRSEKCTLFNKLNPLIIHLLQVLAKISISQDCFRIFLIFYFDLGSTNLVPSDMRNVFATRRSAHHLQVALVEALSQLLLNEKVEPKDIYIFPQKVYPHVKFNYDGIAQDSDALDTDFETKVLDPSWDPSPSGQCVGQVYDAQSLSASLSKLTSIKYEKHSFDQCCAARLVLDWSLRLKDGITVSFWLLSREYQKKAVFGDMEQIHPVCSLSIDGLTFLLQLSSDGCTLLMRSTFNGKMKRSRRLRSVLIYGAWNHIIASVVVDKSVHLAHVRINSLHFVMRTKHEYTKIPKKSSFVFGFGALRNDAASKTLIYELSSIFAFRGFLKTSQALILRGLGCDCVSLTTCNISSLMLRLTSLLSFENAYFQQNAILELLADLGTAYARLQHDFLFVIRDRVAYIRWKSTSQNNPSTLELGHSSPTEKYLLDWNCSLVKRVGKTPVDDCLVSLGSQNLFLFMFAQAIDLKHNAYEQAVTFRLLLQFLRRVSPFIGEYTLSNIYKCVIRCLSSSFACVGVQMLKEFRNVCIYIPPATKSSCERSKKWVIVDPEFIVQLLCSPQLWKGRERMLLWHSLLEDIACCISEETADCFVFSKEQLKRVNFLKKFFQAILEMLQNDNSYRIHVHDVTPLINTLTTVIRTMLGSPVIAEEIIHLWNFILLSHAAAHTYITYSHNDCFQWLQQDLIPERSELHLLSDTDLVHRLKDYSNTLGKNRIIELWIKERSVIRLRQMYEAACSDNNRKSEHSIGRKFPSIAYKNNVLDLVCNPERIRNESDECGEKELSVTMEESLVDWFCDLRCSCLEQLATIVQNAPDTSFTEVVSRKISWQAVITLLTNQSDRRFRDHVFSLLKHILLRANSEIRFDFIKNDGFELLSNQLKGYPPTDEVASSLFSLLFEETVRFNDGLVLDHISFSKVNQFKCLSVKAIFVLWEESVRYSSLYIYWNISSILTTLLSENEMLMQGMMDAGLCATVVSILRRIASLPSVYEL
uniref:Lysosomal-trafficking regulator n=1 Tax=Setaria digitata TaxID=48799 RepID=A0A915PKC0_9BILA